MGNTSVEKIITHISSLMLVTISLDPMCKNQKGHAIVLNMKVIDYDRFSSCN